MKRRVVTKEARDLRDELRETRKVLGTTTLKIEEFTKLIEEIAGVDDA